MTTKQTHFISTLVEQKAIPVDTTDADTSRKAGYVLALAAGHASVTPDVAAASRIIDWLLSLPNREAAQAVGPVAQVVELPESGRYAIEIDGTVKFYKVDCPTTGKWAGRTFVKVQASDDWFPVRDAASRSKIVAAITADVEGAMIRYGHEIGCCGRCGRTLTDETSRAMGIGPECSKIMGIARETVAPAAAPEAVAEVEVDEADQDPQIENEVDYQGLDNWEREQTVTAAVDNRTRLTWRETKALEADARADRVGPTRKESALARCSQLDVLPGETFEDIFKREDV